MSEIKENKLYITPVSDGTALDHLKPWTALKVLEILGLPALKNCKVSVALNVESSRLGRKDLVFIEGKELSAGELEKIGLVCKGGTCNLIKGSKVVKKYEISYPEKAEGIIKCINPACISNKESFNSKFKLVSKEPLKAECNYCETIMNENEIASSVL